MTKNHLKPAISQLVKQAYQGSDADFEKSFSNVAHAFLQDKAPTLQEYELGFQLLDRNEDNTRAVGVFAFKIGSQIMYAPQFFLNGDLKGYELLYLKNQDMFVPISEGWLNHIINKRPQSIGEPHQQESGDGMFKSPQLDSLSRSPMKVAAAQVKVAHYAADFMPLLVNAADADITAECNSLADVLGDTLSLDRLLKQADSRMLDRASRLMSEDSRVLAAVTKWHGLAKFSQAIKTSEARDNAASSTLLGAITHTNQNPVPKAAAAPMLDNDADDVTVYESKYEMPEGVSAAELHVFYSTGTLVRDKRKPAELAQLVDEKRDGQFTSPNMPGLYAVLTAGGQLVDKIVLPNIRGMRHSSSPSEAFVISPTAKSICGDCRFKQQATMVADSGADVQLGYDKWFRSLPEVGTLESGEDYVFVSESGRVTDRISISRSLGKDADGLTSYLIYSSGIDSYSSSSPYGRDRGIAQEFPAHGGVLVVGHKASNTISIQGNKIFVPASAKKLTYEYSHSDEDSKFMPGDVRDAYYRLQKVTTPAKLTANRHDNHYSFDSDMNLKQAAVLKRLMVELELGEQDARAIIKEARRTPGKTVTKLIKKADRIKTASPYLSDAPLPSTPAMPAGLNQSRLAGFKGPVGDSFEVAQPVPGMASSNYPKEGYMYDHNQLEQGLKGFVQNAATDGKRDVFDVGMLSSMLMVASDDRLIDQWVPDLVKGMDRIGRLLFLFYWHYDKFESRFGAQDLPELEEFLRTSFDLLGKLILFLKNKNVQDSPTQGGFDVGLRGEM